MSDTETNPLKPAEPTENQGGGTATATETTSDTIIDNPEAPPAEPTENQGGGSAE